MSDTTSKVKTFYSEFGSMVNTALLVIGLMGAGYTWALSGEATNRSISNVDNKVDNLTNKINEVEKNSLKRWEDHANLHKERQTDLASENASTRERLSSAERELRKYDELSYRQTQTQTNVDNLQEAMKDVQKTINAQSTSLQVMQQILQRIEAKVTK